MNRQISLIIRMVFTQICDFSRFYLRKALPFANEFLKIKKDFILWIKVSIGSSVIYI